MTGSDSDHESLDRWVVVASRFNENVVDRLVAGALDCLEKRGVSRDRVRLVRVAGAWELPQAVNALLSPAGPVEVREEYCGAIALGAVIRGETPHFDHICAAVANGLMAAAQAAALPVSFGVLTCDSMEQALARAGGDRGNKGYEAAEAALNLHESLRQDD